MPTEKEWTIWLVHGGGELFLGLPTPPQDNPVSRFCVLCTMKGEAFGVGVWVEVHKVEERTIPGGDVRRTFTVSPKNCLIPWSLIAYVQAGRRSKSIGFVQVKSGTK